MKSLFVDKKNLWLGLGALALVSGITLAANQPVMAQLQEVKDAIVQAIQRPEVKLTLSAEKQLIELDEKGQEKISWQALAGKVQVQPGDVIRYTVNGANTGGVEAKNLVVAQPVPERTVYQLQSAQSNANADIVYSIDGGQTFTTEPMVEVTLPDGKIELQPAPAEAYTHVQWSFHDDLAAATTVKVSYEVQVR